MFLIILDYLIILLKIAVYFYGLLLLSITALLVVKPSSSKLIMHGDNLVESLEEVKASYIRIAKIFIVLLVSRIIISKVVETETHVYILYWLNKALLDHEVILGVFIASLLSIFVHICLNNVHKRNEVRKNSTALYNDLKIIIDTLTKAKLLIEVVPKDIDQKKFLFHGLNPIIEIRHNTRWRDHYTSIHEHLPYKYYKKVDTLYSVVEDFNKAVRQEDISLLKRVFIRALPGQVGGYVYLQKVTTTQLTKALERLTINKRVKSDVYKFLFNELLFFVIKFFTHKKFEIKMISIIRDNEIITDDNLESEIKDWLAEPAQKYLKCFCWGVLPRLLFETGSRSKYIKRIWDEYSLTEKTE